VKHNPLTWISWYLLKINHFGPSRKHQLFLSQLLCHARVNYLWFFCCLFNLCLVLDYKPKSLMFETLTSLLLEVSTSPFVLYHSMLYLRLHSQFHCRHNLKLSAPHWLQQECCLQSIWQLVGMSSLQLHTKISGNSCSWPTDGVAQPSKGVVKA
jgi:hypothetical protein